VDIRRSGKRGVVSGNGKSRNAISSYSSATFSILFPMSFIEATWSKEDSHGVNSSVIPHTSEKAPPPPVDRYTSFPCPFSLHREIQLSYNVSLLQSSTYYQSIPNLVVGKHTRPHQHPVYFQILSLGARISLSGAWRLRGGS